MVFGGCPVRRSQRSRSSSSSVLTLCARGCAVQKCCHVSAVGERKKRGAFFGPTISFILRVYPRYTLAHSKQSRFWVPPKKAAEKPQPSVISNINLQVELYFVSISNTSAVDLTIWVFSPSLDTGKLAHPTSHTKDIFFYLFFKNVPFPPLRGPHSAHSVWRPHPAHGAASSTISLGGELAHLKSSASSAQP